MNNKVWVLLEKTEFCGWDCEEDHYEIIGVFKYKEDAEQGRDIKIDKEIKEERSSYYCLQNKEMLKTEYKIEEWEII